MWCCCHLYVLYTPICRKTIRNKQWSIQILYFRDRQICKVPCKWCKSWQFYRWIQHIYGSVFHIGKYSSMGIRNKNNHSWYIVSSPLKLGGFLVFKIWTKSGVIKKLLRNRGVSWKRGVLLERGWFPNCLISFHSEKHVFITVGILFLSFFVW